MPTLRFHWDFLGPDAPITAKHFCHHLEEFCELHKIAEQRTFTTDLQGRSVASLECDEQHMLLVRDLLRPKRAERLG
ncbi:MAG: hypothetical protein JST38_09600 [Bacteroidetes bacterium]|nr:hypothetical protein [Bacteroidota bacterium]MBS1941119.1 hypothetical protein [Bacteroidota bacterium]